MITDDWNWLGVVSNGVPRNYRHKEIRPMSLQTTSPKDLVGMCTIYFMIYNSECCKFHGCSIRAIIIKEWTPFVHQDDRSKAEFGKEFRLKGIRNNLFVTATH